MEHKKIFSREMFQIQPWCMYMVSREHGIGIYDGHPPDRDAMKRALERKREK